VARSVVFDIIANTQGFTRGMSQAQRSATQFQKHTSRLRSDLASAFAGAAVVAGIRKVVAAGRESQAVARQTAAVIKSTGGAAGLTAKQFGDLANAISKKVGVDDEVIQSGENILATFTGVRNEVGKGNDIFNQATMAAVDMAAAMNHGEVTADGLQTANIQLGKALNDPIKGMGALRRVGVAFTAQQQQQIKTLVASGHTLEAQKIILGELRKEFGGSAEANATASKKLAVAWGNLQEGLGKALIPAIERGAVWLNRLVEGFNRLDETSHGVASQAVLTGAVLGGLAVAVAKVTTPILDARKAWMAYRAAKAAQVAVDAAVGTAEETLAAKTAATGAAATAASGGFAALAGKLALYGGAAAALVVVASKLSTEQGRQTAIIDRHGSILDRIKRATTVFGFEQDKATASTRAATQATRAFGGTVQLGTKFGGLYTQSINAMGHAATDGADHFSRMAEAASRSTAATTAGGAAASTAAAKMAANSQQAATLTAKLKELKQGFRDQVAATRDAIAGYDGLIAKSGVTARQVIHDLRNQVINFRTYAKDTQRLIKAGVDPRYIQELSKRGPQYVHALATGSNAQLQLAKRYFAQRQTEIRTSFAASMQRQYADLVAKMKAMQRQINALKGKNVNVTATAKATIAKQTVAWLRASHVKIPQLAAGGKVTQGTGPTADDVLARLSKGETVVSARDSADPGFQAWAAQRKIPGFATGGRIGSLQPFADASAAALRRGAQHGIDALAGQLGKALGRMIDAAVAGMGGGGSEAIKAFIRSTDRLPYRWGAAGPAAYDCSGLVGAVYGLMRGRGGGRGQRYFTTGSIGTGIPGILPGLGGLLDIGVRRPGAGGSGHMAGVYGGLPFEARSTASGIIVGPAARKPGSFGIHFHVGVPGGGTGGTAGVKGIVREVFAGMFGWGSAGQWAATDALVSHESGWRPTAQNPSSTAYGLFQFLNSTWATVGGHKTSDPRLQAIYGGRYIRSRYHNPAGAWAFWLRHHSYDAGGWLPPGLSLAYNGTGRSERVTPGHRSTDTDRALDRLTHAFGRLADRPIVLKVNDVEIARAVWRGEARLDRG
jgi:Transglycosylase SLT domain